MLLCYPLHFTVVMRPAHQPVFFNTTTCMEKPILSTSTRWTVDKRECRGSYAVWKLGSHSHNRAVESAPDEDMSRGMQNLGFCPRPNLEHGKRYPVRNSVAVQIHRFY